MHNSSKNLSQNHSKYQLIIEQLKNAFNEMFEDNRNMMVQLRNQNNYMDMQIAILQQNFCQHSRSGFLSNSQSNSENYIKYSNPSSINLHKSQVTSLYDSRVNTQMFQDFQSDEQLNHKNDQILEGLNYHNLKSSNVRTFQTEKKINQNQQPKLEQIPGNPIQHRLVDQFFTTGFQEMILIDGNPQSRIYKKQLLSAYLYWRKKHITCDLKPRLVGIQMALTYYVKQNFRKCFPLRHQFSGMKFKSLEIVKEIMRNVDLKQLKGPVRKRQKKVKKQEKLNFDQEYDQQINFDLEQGNEQLKSIISDQ